MRRLTVAPFVVLAASAVFAACGGGGGGSSGGGPTPPTPTPTATATPAVAQGSLRDLGAQRYSGDGGAAGAAIAGATVVVGPTLIVGATPPATYPVGDAHATTQADGSYSVVGYTTPTPTYVMVFPAAGDAHVSLHALAKVSNATVRTLHLYAPSAVETAELAQINTDRSANGSGPVVFDEIALETARAHADFMATNGYYQHCIPAANCSVVAGFPTTPPASYAAQYSSPDDLYNYLGGALQLAPASNVTENFVVNESSWNAADAWFMAEKPANGGHYLNIVNPAHNWVGLGDNQNPIPPAGFGLYIQEFY